MRLVSGVSEVAGEHDALLVDLWGVLFDGGAAFPEAVDCLRRLRDAGRPSLVLSNAPRRAHSVRAQMLEGGFPDWACALVMTSGEAAWRLLREGADGRLPPPHLYIGPGGARHRDELLEGLSFAEGLDDAGSILLSGARGDGWSTPIPDGLLEEAAARGLPLLCANPDLEVMRRGVRQPCAGATALEYERMGGRVVRVGKPHPEIYRLAEPLLAEALGGRAPERPLAVGDGLATDVAGANRAGIASALVLSGIHAESLDGGGLGRLERLCARHGARPDLVMESFSWEGGQ